MKTLSRKFVLYTDRSGTGPFGDAPAHEASAERVVAPKPTHLSGAKMLAFGCCCQRETRSAHQHSLHFGRSLILNARKHVGISLQRERNARVAELV